MVNFNRLDKKLTNVEPVLMEDEEAILDQGITKILWYDEVDNINQWQEELKEVENVEQSINQRLREKTEKQQREYILREKLKATQDELNDLTGGGEESEEQEILKKLG